MKTETPLPLGALDPGPGSAAAGLDLARIGEEARLAEALGYGQRMRDHIGAIWYCRRNGARRAYESARYRFSLMAPLFVPSQA